MLLEALHARFKECSLALHPEKTQLMYCKDDDRRCEYPKTQFDFLGYTFRPRRAKNRDGKFFVPCTPGVSHKAAQALRQTIHDWRMHLQPDKSLEDLSRMFNPVLRGWSNYSGCFYKSAMYPTLLHMDHALGHWVRRKDKTFHRH